MRKLYTVYRAARPELGEELNTWFVTTVTRSQKVMLREQMYYLRQGIEVKVKLEE